MADAPRDDLADIREQGLEVGRQRIAGRMQTANHLVQIISKAYELAVDEPLDLAGWLPCYFYFSLLIEQQYAAEMYRPHSDRFSAQLNAREFVDSETQIELLASWI